MTRVLVTMRSIREPDTGELRDSLSRDWTRYLNDIGVTAIPIPNNIVDPGEYLRTLSPDALLLTNGENVGSHAPRDRTERALVSAATADDLPVLGVCRGHQFINSYYGGELIAIDEYNRDSSHAGTEHDVQIHDTPTCFPIADTITVNSYHDMGLVPDVVAPELETFATTEEKADNGLAIVEGLYHPRETALSIQWHPERPLPDREPVDRLVTRFLEGELRW